MPNSGMCDRMTTQPQSLQTLTFNSNTFFKGCLWIGLGLVITSNCLKPVFDNLAQGQTETLTCQRVEPTQIDCILEQKRWFAPSPASAIAVAHVQKITVQALSFPPRYSLQTPQGSYPLQTLESKDIEQLNRFFKQSSQPSLSIQNSTQIIEPLTLIELSLLGLPILTFGIYLLLFKQTIILEPSQGELILKTQNWQGKKSEKYLLKFITSVIVQEVGADNHPPKCIILLNHPARQINLTPFQPIIYSEAIQTAQYLAGLLQIEIENRLLYKNID